MDSALGRARTKLDAGDDEGALADLLVAWRKTRNGGIADAIDRVTKRIVDEHGPIKEKTVKGRTEAWLALAGKSPSVRDVCRLLATPWPGKYPEATPVAAQLIAFPHDPRIAMAFANIVLESPWDSIKSQRFYPPLIRHLEALGDPRTLPVLEAELQKPFKTWDWTKETRPLVAAAIAKLKAAPEPTLDASEEKELAAVNACFAGDVAAEAAATEKVATEKVVRAKASADQATREPELLEAIYAAPGDDTPRIVYADFLQEHGDPRGELITLQLERAAGRSSPKSAKREAALFKEHWTKLAGPLNRLVGVDGRMFERGFLTRATLVFEGTDLSPDFDERAWATVHTLDLHYPQYTHGPLLRAFLALPTVRHLRALHGVDVSVAADLPFPPRLEAIELVHYHSDHPIDPRIVDGSAFPPTVRRLGIRAAIEHIEPLLAGALGRRVEEVTLVGSRYPLGPLSRMVSRLGLTNVRAVRTASYVTARDDDGWCFSLARDAGGAFTVLTGALGRSGRGVGRARELVEALESLEPNELTALIVDRSEPAGYSAHELRQLEEQLARFPGLGAIEVPWERITSTPSKVDDRSVLVTARLQRTPRLDGPTYAKLWRAAVGPPLSLSFDSYEVNGETHQALEGDGLKVAEKARAKKRTWSVAVYRKNGLDRLTLRHDDIIVKGVIARDPEASTRYLEWLADLSEELGARGTVPCVTVVEEDGVRQWAYPAHELHFQSFNMPSAWTLVLDAAIDAKIPFAELEKLPARPGFEWLRFVRRPHTMLLLLAPGPNGATKREELEQLDIAAYEILWDQFQRRHGYRPQELVATAFDPLLAGHGFTRAEPSKLFTAEGKLLYRREDREIHFEPTAWRQNDNLSVHFKCRHAERALEFGPTSKATLVLDAEAMKGAVASAVQSLDYAVGWFDKPEKRRR